LTVRHIKREHATSILRSRQYEADFISNSAFYKHYEGSCFEPHLEIESPENQGRKLLSHSRLKLINTPIHCNITSADYKTKTAMIKNRPFYPIVLQGLKPTDDPLVIK
jgi:hypothetical protein